MTRILAFLSTLIVVVPATGTAQDVGDAFAYVALTFTPLGAFVSLPPPTPMATRGSAFVLRYGNLDPSSPGNSLHQFAVGADLGAGRGHVGLTLGGTACEGCDGSVMAGLDYTVPLSQGPLSAALRPAIGFSKPLDGGGSAVSLGLSLPLGAELAGTSGPIFIPFIVPGFGFGRLSGDGGSESGTRGMLGGGLAIAGRQSNVAVHLGVHKVFIDGGDTVLGIGMSFGRRRAATP